MLDDQQAATNPRPVSVPLRMGNYVVGTATHFSPLNHPARFHPKNPGHWPMNRRRLHFQIVFPLQADVSSNAISGGSIFFSSNFRFQPGMPPSSVIGLTTSWIISALLVTIGARKTVTTSFCCFRFGYISNRFLVWVYSELERPYGGAILRCAPRVCHWCVQSQ